ncbi:SDR family oxidoreductase [Rhodalgimonas zhirmunskyi]|uniref:SDR family oxidoreductase n=1 Tax=Rhodalgimonas zhirmunskyi TaxID=2964767 RepID=A0AAJ1X668_9RHOB|nr:SDR family oxidoreductase [Rhodoalgimonas zhirmunskyi]MDQ2095196.1 SDR family oxidoreductase [Rhodoalgimonas zhirmunskyi]
MPRNILITGTSTGLGIALAVQAAQAGFKVYATMRDLTRRAALDTALESAGVAAEVLQLDVRDTASIQTAVDHIIAADGHIDVLLNNAGAGYVRTTEQAPEDEVTWVMDVNFHGVARCVKAVMPHMRQARAGHIVTISSVGGLVGQPFNEFYCAAKFAVEGYMESMASYITPSFGINFTVVEPGGIATEFANNVMKQIGETGGLIEDEYLPILQSYIGSREGRDEGVFQTADEVAEVTLNAILSDTPPLRTRTSEWSENLCRLKTDLDPTGLKLRDKVSAEFLS